MAAPLLAQYLGGGRDSFWGNFMLAFVSAVAFATIVAVVAGLVLAAASAMAHDLYVGVLRAGRQVSSGQQVAAARVATLIVGAMAILIGIAAKGQNVAVLVGLAFAVAASANFPCILLTLYWRRANTAGMVAGMVVGTLVAVGLTLVSPNLTYPLQKIAAANKVLDAEQAKRTAIEAVLQNPWPQSESLIVKARAEQVALDKAIRLAQADIKKYEGQSRSFMGLKEPLISLKNPGVISIPAGFLAAILASLWIRDERARAKWSELYVRQNTGMGISKSVSH